MKTAIDTSVLLAIFLGEPAGSDWLDRLVDSRREGRLVICSVVFAELAPVFEDEDSLRSALARMGVEYENLSPSAAFLAGRLFRQYRAEGGRRERLIPDFMIGAHALKQADRLASVDRGYFRRYFEGLRLLEI